MRPKLGAWRLLLVTALGVPLGLETASQAAAAAWGHAPALGGTLATIGPVAIYPPWRVLEWALHICAGDSQVLADAALWGLLAGLLPALVVGLARKARRPRASHPVSPPKEPVMPAPTAPSHSRVWRNVLPTGAPGASQGTPYSFWVREADPTKLAIIFAGGGTCWTGENSALHCRPHYRAFAGLELDPTEHGGIFDLAHPENPLADYTMVFLPTANGDLFLGDAAPTYDTPAMNGHPAGQVNILHKGFDNAMLALDWTFRTYPQPKTVAVMGWSAGALASPLYTHIVASHYPKAVVTHFADGGGAYHLGDKLAPLFNSWNTAGVMKRVEGFQDVPIAGLTIEDLYVRAAKLHPEIVFHQYNERRDAVQGMFMQLIGERNPDVPAKLDEAHAYIRAQVPNFRTFTSWGRDEAIIGGYYDAVPAVNALDNRGAPHVLDRLYTRKTHGVRFLDWFKAAVTGQPVQDVACSDCDTPEYHWSRPGFPSQEGARPLS